MSKTLRLQYFALLREQRKVASETVTTDVADARALYEDLRVRHGFTLPAERLRVALNGEFVPWPAPLSDGDEVVFIPPVAGG
jgi:sulfur-carrier protein